MGIVTKDGQEFHKGNVVAVVTQHAVQIMSDVWANITYAVCYLPEGVEQSGDSFREYSFNKSYLATRPGYNWEPVEGTFVWIQTGNTEFGADTSILAAIVDASEEAQAAWEGWQRGKSYAAKIRTYDADEWRLQQARARVARDKLVRVVSGRKVPKGTEGRVFWTGQNAYGSVVGIGLPDADGSFPMVMKTSVTGKSFQSYANVVFVASHHVRVIDQLGGRVLSDR